MAEAHEELISKGPIDLFASDVLPSTVRGLGDKALGEPKINEVDPGAFVYDDGGLLADNCEEIGPVTEGIKHHVVWFHVRVQIPYFVELPQTLDLNMQKLLKMSMDKAKDLKIRSDKSKDLQV